MITTACGHSLADCHTNHCFLGGFNAREASMIRVALRDKAAEYRRMAKSRQYGGPGNADLRERARAEARDYDKLAASRRLQT